MSEMTAGSLDIQPIPPGERRYMGLTHVGWTQVAILGGLFAITFLICLRRLWLKTNPISGDPNWSHAICVPVIGLYYLYTHRKQLRATPIEAAWSALPILFAGLFLFAYGIYPGQNDFIKDVGMIGTLFGLVAFLTGWQMMKILWFPICFFVCALPWPPLVYSMVALPLQGLAAQVAVWSLQIAGVNSFYSGTKILMEGYNSEIRTLNVAEACAGLRSLMTFVTIGGAMAFLSGRPLWQKITMTLSAVPIAISCNVMRVSGQGLLDHYWSREWSQGFAHQFAGMVMLVPAFFLLLLVGWLLDRVFVEEVTVAVDDAAAANAEVAAKLESEASAAGTPLFLPPRRSHNTIRRSKAKSPSHAGAPVPTLPQAGGVSGTTTPKPDSAEGKSDGA
jgi:exosortase